VANGRTLARYQEEIREDIQRLSLIHGLDDLRRFTPQWYEAVVFQLTRMPTDIMIERWLCEQYPDMRKLQTASLLEQHGKAVSILSRSYRRMTPGKIYHVTQVMNYVFFRLLGERLDVHLVEPYERSGYSLEGGDLADWTACHYSEDHEGDVRVIGHWARCLGISEWIEWRRFDEISQEYLH
jgi:hypothetical protein